MARFIGALAIASAVTLLPLAQLGPSVQASGGLNNPETVALHRQDCTATAVGTTVGTARFSLDDQGGENVNPGGMEIRTGLTAGLPRTTYGVYVLAAPCQVLVQVGTLKTDDSGRGDLDAHVLGSQLPANASLRVEVVAPASATVPGTGPFTDVITSDPT